MARGSQPEIFAGADVVIIPDNDPQTKHAKTDKPMFHPDGRPMVPGQDHAEAVAVALSAVANKVRVLDLAKAWPDMPLKGDVSDWLDNGGSAEALYDLIDSASLWSGRPNGGDGQEPHDEAGQREFAPLDDEGAEPPKASPTPWTFRTSRPTENGSSPASFPRTRSRW